MLIVEVFVGLTSGASVIMAQFYGARDRQNLNKTLHTAYAFAIVTGTVVGIIRFSDFPQCTGHDENTIGTDDRFHYLSAHLFLRH